MKLKPHLKLFMYYLLKCCIYKRILCREIVIACDYKNSLNNITLFVRFVMRSFLDAHEI